ERSGIEDGLHAPPAPAGRCAEGQCVDEAPGPVLARLEGLHDRVIGREEVLRGVAVRAGVAAVRRPADQTLPGVDPGAADLDAGGADVRARLPSRIDLIGVRADGLHAR